MRCSCWCSSSCTVDRCPSCRRSMNPGRTAVRGAAGTLIAPLPSILPSTPSLQPDPLASSSSFFLLRFTHNFSNNSFVGKFYNGHHQIRLIHIVLTNCDLCHVPRSPYVDKIWWGFGDAVHREQVTIQSRIFTRLGAFLS